MMQTGSLTMTASIQPSGALSLRLTGHFDGVLSLPVHDTLNLRTGTIRATSAWRRGRITSRPSLIFWRVWGTRPFEPGVPCDESVHEPVGYSVDLTANESGVDFGSLPLLDCGDP